MTMQHSPLDAAHRRLGAKMGEFGGWDMPLQYESGTLTEHRACRSNAVVFDVSHLGTVLLDVPDAHERLQRALTNDLDKVGPGRAQYTHLLDVDDASVLDDIIVWWVDDTTFHVMPNASNTDRVVGALGDGARDITAERAILALQGPTARALLQPIAPAAAAVGRFHVIRFEWHGVACLAAGTGYTGEDGVEIAVPTAAAEHLWDAVLAGGFQPAGLAARDTLRLEAGLPLHGHELGAGITPLQAGLGWVVSWTKGPFRGRDALERERDAGPARRLRGIQVDGRRPPRAGHKVLVDGEAVGEVTSGNFSPVLGTGIAMALLRSDIDVATPVTIDARGSELIGRTVPMPFIGRPG